MIHEIQYKPTLKQLEAIKLLTNREKRFYLFYGGSRSGKTLNTFQYIRARALKYPKSKHLVARYSFTNAKKTIWLQTMLPIFKDDHKNGLGILSESNAIFTYANGSTIRLASLEPDRIDSVLSSEYATIFINEANENKYSIIETLMTRLNDTSIDATGRMIDPKFICDLNPTSKKSWSYEIFIKGIDPETKKVRDDFNLFGSLQMNPYDNQENLNPTYFETLKNLSPGKRKRFFEGEFSSYEGLVFPAFNEEKHVIDDFQIPENWKRYMAIDFGFIHPFVCLWFAVDPVNDRIYVYREYVQTKTTVSNHSKVIFRKCLEDFPKYQNTIMTFYKTWSDHDAEDRATLEENGIETSSANKDVIRGIDTLTDLLEAEKSTVFIMRKCQSLIGGLLSYRWKFEDKESGKDRVPMKVDDDEVDAFRYGIMGILNDQKESDYNPVFSRALY